MGSRHPLSSSSPCLSSLCPSCPFPSSLSSLSSLSSPSFLHHPRASAYTHAHTHASTHLVTQSILHTPHMFQPLTASLSCNTEESTLKPPDSARIQLSCAGDDDCTLPHAGYAPSRLVRLTPPSSLCLKMASEPPSSTSGNSGNLPVASL